MAEKDTVMTEPAAARETRPRKAKKEYSRPWLHANRMKVNPRPGGLASRWLSRERLSLPKDDPRGPGEWVPDPSRHPELRKRIDDGSKLGNVTELPGVVLCEAPQEWLDERNAYMLAKCKSQRLRADAELKQDVKRAGGEVFEPAEFGDVKKP